MSTSEPEHVLQLAPGVVSPHGEAVVDVLDLVQTLLNKAEHNGKSVVYIECTVVPLCLS